MYNSFTRGLAKFFKKRLVDNHSGRKPDFVIGGKEAPYMERWWIIPRNRFFNIYLHKIMRDDDDRALHDHPWLNVSIVLDGGYLEHTPEGLFLRSEGDVIFRKPTSLHRLVLFKNEKSKRARDEKGRYLPGGETQTNRPTWSLFITGPRVREWGFQCPKGWISYKKFVSTTDHGAVGAGCGD